MNRKNKTGIIITIGFAILVIGTAILAGLYYLQNNPPEKQLSEAEKAALHAASIEGQFETALNTFLDNVSTRVKAYKLNRKIIQDLVKTDNLRSPEYITENYAIATEMIPQMNTEINSVLSEFQAADARMNALIKNEDIKKQNIILERWKKVRAEQAKIYIDFFAFEQELLNRYLRLLEIYNEGRDNIEIIPAEGGNVQLHISDKRLQKRADIIKEDIESLKRAQSASLN